MRWPTVPIVMLTLLVVSSAASSQTVEDTLGEILDLHRKIVVVLDEAGEGSEELEHVGRRMYARQQGLIRGMLSGAPDAQVVVDYVGRTDLLPGDRLAFGELVEELALAEGATRGGMGALRVDIEATRSRFGDEVGTSRGEESRTAWRTYVSDLRRSISLADILRQFPLEPAPGLRGGHPYGEHARFGYQLPKKHLVLTFDDGPHARHTESILEILEEHGATAYFFAVGRNLGSFAEDGEIVWSRASLHARLSHEAGHVLSNHSYSHRQMPKLTEGERERELAETNRLIAAITGEPPHLFRPPYGDTNRALTDAYASSGMTSILWNVDSWDWGDPVPESIARRVVERVERAERGILLFHDVHKQTVAALPLILKELALRGYRFANLEGELAQAPRPMTTLNVSRSDDAAVARETAPASPYRESWALVIGIDAYHEWPRLHYAGNDASAVEAVLRESFGFREENIITLIDDDATRDRIVEALGETLADPSRVEREDRVFVFFAGHGMTRRLPTGGELGYIVPVDADLRSYQVRSISMSQLQDFSELIPAKHVYFVMDSCYSGVALTRGGGAGPYFQEVTRRTARQILTAGGADQAVADDGPGGHSIFTWTLLQGLQGLADLDGNGLLTATELGAFTAPVVSKFSTQTPAFGNLEGSEGGEFVFELELENLSSVSRQLDAEALAMTAELERLQKEVSTKLERNLQLSREVERVRTGLDTDTLPLSDEQRFAQANRHHALGLQYFREKRYEGSLDELSRAVALNGANATIVNNYGFVLYRMGRFEESLRWFEQTIALDPDRAVVYVNMADSLLELGRNAEAARYYRRYLTLWPDSPRRADIETVLARVGR